MSLQLSLLHDVCYLLLVKSCYCKSGPYLAPPSWAFKATLIRKDFKECFGELRYNPYDNKCEIGSPPQPLGQDEFLRKTAAISARYAPKTKLDSLDSYEGLADKMLFKDGQLYNFSTGELRPVKPEDRLCRKCQIPFPVWQGSLAVKEHIMYLGQLIVGFYMAGGKSLHRPPHGNVAEALAEPLTPEQEKYHKEIQRVFALLIKEDDAPWTKAVHNMWANLDEMIYTLRVVARVFSGKRGFAQAYAFTGPPSSGKSLLVMSMLRLLGEGPEHYTTPLGSGYFVNKPRSDGEASKPVTNQCKGAKLVVPKESPVAPLVPESLKAILDARDVQVQARHNNSKKGAKTTFAPTWSIVIQSQGDIQNADPADVGFWDKVAEMRPPYRFVPEEDITDPEVQKVADAVLAEQCDNGAFSSEIFLWAMAMYPTLAAEVCKHRCILPEPESVTRIRKEAQKDCKPALLKDFLVEHFEHCAPEHATPATEVNAYIDSNMGKMSSAEKAMASLGPNRDQYRGGAKKNHFNYYKHSLGGLVRKPITLKKKN